MTIDQTLYLPLSTKEGWSRFVAHEPAPPERITHAEQSRLSPADKAAHDETRRKFMTAAGIIRTPEFEQILMAAEIRLRLNEFKPSGKLGLIVSGAPGLGKTTTVTQIGKLHTARRQQQEHPAGRPGNIPVVYVTVPPACGPKAMIAEFAEFLNLPTTGRTSHSAMLNSVSTVMARLRVELVIVDEIHNLNVNYRMSADASDALKQLSEKCAATFIYAGVNVESCGLLDGARGQQIASRFELHRASPFSNRSQTKRSEWEAVLLGMEETLYLTRQKEGDILKHSGDLFAATGGSIGQLADMLHLSALKAIDDGTERLTGTRHRRVPKTVTKQTPSEPALVS
jgi:DNA polymerase III delta prime subunit